MLMKQKTYGRIELKYRLRHIDYLKLRNAITPFMKKDQHTRASSSKGYFVRSLYYDTYDYQAYHEKMSGDNQRVKYRLRSYSKEIYGVGLIRAELKVRISNRVEKHSTVISQKDYYSFIKRRCWLSNNNYILQEFERIAHQKDLQPLLLVEYYREGYRSRFGDDLRITFDHEVSSAHSNILFPDHLFFKEHHPNLLVMEIKFKDELPPWVFELVQNHGLKVIANSKFTQGIQVARKNLHHPHGVVIVR